MKQLFVAWTFMRRPESMQPHFNYELTFITFAFNKRYLRLLEYIIKAAKTLLLFVQKHPDVIWVQIAPTPLLYTAHLYKALFNRQVIIIADCHNSMFRAPWIKFPGALSLLNRCELVLPHNELVKEQAIELGVKSDRLCILETRPALLNPVNIEIKDNFPHPWILFACSFNADEPIEVVLAAASLIPDITFIVTGKTARAEGMHDLSNAPPNLKLVGFLPKSEFDMLLCCTDAVLGLTTLEGVQLSVANEAVGTGKPMILSETKILKKLFYKGAVYVDSLNAESIAKGCREAISRKSELTAEVERLKEERNQRWLGQASKVDAILNGAQVHG
ncbi:glycosyltransferase [Argonema antarcticum]|uniref:glycosyltransferase n=1 Tax=Argonema antarcticum TaxID=2942763 RepID=UPI002010D462|nr:glycosyltransferase [Argonema antarcticum]MCL1469339.1 glycosyltransferase [Argonema antarcticum A004/B2]